MVYLQYGFFYNTYIKLLSRSVKSVAGKAYLLTLSFEGVKESGLEGGVPFGIWGQLGSGVKVGRFRFWVGYLISFGNPQCFW